MRDLFDLFILTWRMVRGKAGGWRERIGLGLVCVGMGVLGLTGVAGRAAGAVNDSPWIYGIYWYGDPLSTDVEAMSGGKGIWDLEIALLDASVTNASDRPAFYLNNVCPVVGGRNHSMIFRLQPNWSRNVPYTGSPADPYTLSDYGVDAAVAASQLGEYVHIWQIGNEVNLNVENRRWDGSGYRTQWQPTPAQYAAVYEALRYMIHGVTPTTNPADQIVLMAPMSPGLAIAGTRFMDGNEFLWRMIDAVGDKSTIDGFALDGYSDPATALTDYGMEGFWDLITEQLCIIDQFGLGDRPVFITEFNKQMPDAANANVAAKFVQAAYEKMNTWNGGAGDMWPGQPNHNVVCATWFVYSRSRYWDSYSLLRWKTGIEGTDPNFNPWYGFQASASRDYARGVYGTGPSVSMSSEWWADDFNGPAGSAPDTTAPVPDWKVENVDGGHALLSGTGELRLVGDSAFPNSSGSIRTAGYAYGNFRLEADVLFTDVGRASAANADANFDVRIREGSKGYSLTFFTSSSGVNANHIILRRTAEWVTIGGCDQEVPGGINNGDRFHVSVVANGSDLHYEVRKNSGETPVVSWAVSDGGQVAGTIRFMTWNLREARLQSVRLGGPLWDGTVGAGNWMLY